MSDTFSLGTPGVHEKKIRSIFKKKMVFDGDAPVFEHPLYLLAFANRSGSNLLADYLRNTAYFGGFHEQLNYNAIEKQAEAGSCTSLPDTIRYMSTARLGGASAWGFKASWDQIMMLYRARIDKMYPSVKIIHSTRHDIVSQAVSYLIASQTKKWSSKLEGNPEVEPKYDYKLITNLAESCALSEQRVRMIATMFGAGYVNIGYDPLVRRPQAIMKRIGVFAGIDLADWTPHKPSISKQASAVNTEFYERYLADRRAELLKT